METKQATVLPSGWEAQVENTNDIFPLTWCEPPGSIVNVKQVYAIKNIMGQNEIITKQQYDNYCVANLNQTTPTYTVFEAFEVVSEEESKATTVVASAGQTVEEAAVKWFMDNHGIASPNSAFKAGANHIIQSGEYVKIEDVLMKMGSTIIALHHIADDRTKNQKEIDKINYAADQISKLRLVVKELKNKH